MKDNYNLVNDTIRSWMNNTQDFVFVKNRDFIYEGASEAFVVDCAGCSSEENLIGKTDFEVFENQELAAKYRKDDEKIFESRVSMIEYKEAYPDKEGRKRYCVTTKHVILDSCGEPIGILGQFRDITEQIELEHSDKSKQMLINRQRNIFNALREIYYMVLFLDFTNESYLHIIGNEALSEKVHSSGKMSDLFYNWIMKDIASEMCDECKVFLDLSTMCNRMTKYGTLSHEINTQKYGWLRVSLVPVEKDDSGNVVNSLWVAEKIDKEVQMRGELENRIAILNALYSVYNACMYWDLKADRYFSVSNESDKTMREMVPGGVLSEAISEWMKKELLPEDQRELKNINNLEMLAKRLTNEGVIVKEIYSKTAGWQRTSMIPAKYDIDGNVVACLWVGESIDEEKRKEIAQTEVMKQAYEAVTRANSAKTEFLSRVSHDIRTPMNAIIGMTDIAEAYIDDKQRVQDCLKKITYSSRHLLTLINEVLDMSKIESGNIQTNEEEFGISELIDEAVSIIEPLIMQKKHELTINSEKIKHKHVIGDRLHIQQVFTNIMSNAIKYTPDGGNIRVEVSEKDNNSSSIATYEFIFEDNGIGMSEEYLEHIYEPFSREEDSRTNRILGTGLGMSIVINIVKMLGGEIKIDSKKGIGSKFTVTLHLKIQNVEQNGNKMTKLQSGKIANMHIESVKNLQEHNYEGRRVLIVEDQELNREIARMFLEMTGVTVDEVENGLQAVAAVEKSNENYYDMILMDIQMPVMNGYEATRNIRKLDRNDVKEMPIVAMTANAFVADVNEAIDAGMDEHIAKPIELAKFRMILEKWFCNEDVRRKDMTIKEYYEAVGGNYNEALERFMDEERIKKYLLKFPKSNSFSELCAAMESENYEEAFMAVHSMKGITANMAFTEINKLTVLLTEELRDGKCGENKEMYFEKLKEKYNKAIELLELV